MELSGKRILITGAARGIGLACARIMQSQGARVLGSDIDAVALAAVAGPVGMTATTALDVADEQDWIAAAAHARRTLGGIDALVHCAGIGVGGELTTMTLESWRRQQAVNLDGAFLAIKHMLPLVRETGAGSITLIASVTGLRGSAVFGPYAASKAGVIALMRSAARASAAARDGVRVNAIAPGVIDTPIFDHMEGVDAAASDHGGAAGAVGPRGTPRRRRPWRRLSGQRQGCLCHGHRPADRWRPPDGMSRAYIRTDASPCNRTASAAAPRRPARIRTSASASAAPVVTASALPIPIGPPNRWSDSSAVTVGAIPSPAIVTTAP